jgi:type IV pilus assembly protein PilQ
MAFSLVLAFAALPALAASPAGQSTPQITPQFAGAAEAAARPNVSTIGVDGPGAPAVAAPTLAAVPALDQVKISSVNGGGDTLSLRFVGEAPPVDMRQGQRQIILDLGNTQFVQGVGDQLRLLQGTKVIQRVSAVNGAGKVGAASTSRLVIDLNDNFVASAYQAGAMYVLEVSPRVATVVQRDTKVVRRQMAAVSQVGPNAVHHYVGKPVTFNFQDVPVRTVLQLLADESQKNIIAADSVGGNVTLRLNNVPWDQALSVVLQAKGLDKREDGKVIWVAPQPEIAKFEQDKENARIALEGKEPLSTDYIRINYHNAAAIYKAITEAKGNGGSAPAGDAGAGGGGESESSFLSSRGRLVLDQRTNTLIVSDIPSKIQQLRELVSQIDRPVDQVLIEARIVVANSTFARDLGARFGIFGRRNGSNDATIGTATVPGSGAAPGWNSNLPAGTFTNSPIGALAYTLLGRNFSLDFELSAMQEEGKGEVVSNPRLITSNQREGVIQQGKEIGYVTVTGSGGGGAATPSVQFKEALLEMRVTPTITNDGKVFLDLKVKKDDIDQFLDLGVYGAVPTLNRREINTAVLVEDGQTVVIGGVYEFTDRDSVAKVPFLGDVPFLGNLFKKRGRSKEKAEMLIFITPRTIRVAPAEPLILPAPIQTVTEPAGELG